MARIDNLNHYLTDLADSIRVKTGESLPIPANAFDTYIKSIKNYDLSDFFNVNFTGSRYTQDAAGFKQFLANAYVRPTYCPLPIDLGNLNISLESLFENNASLKCAPIFVGTDGVLSTSKMLKGCAAAQFPSESSWIFNNVVDASEMFSGCNLLNNPTIGFQACENTSSMFEGCYNITYMNLKQVDFSTITTYTNMFGGEGSSISSIGVPNNCKIVVKDNTDKEWIQSRFSRLNNVVVE